jgi:predicted transposase/invertase (TIGR01784 family)
VVLANAVPEIGEEIMTFAQQFKQEGLQQGLKSGERNKSFEIARNLLMSGVDQQIIKRSNGLSDEDISRRRLY